MWRLLIASIVGVALFAPAPGSSSPVSKPMLAFARGGDVYTVAADGSGARPLIRRAYAPSWSPDGQSIAFVSRRSGDEEIYVARADGTQAKRVTTSPGPDLSPAWSPDGKRLAWSSRAEIWTMSATGASKRKLVGKAQIWHEHYHPTWHGDRIVHSSNRVSNFNTELFSVRASDGGGLRGSPSRRATTAFSATTGCPTSRRTGRGSSSPRTATSRARST